MGFFLKFIIEYIEKFFRDFVDNENIFSIV